MSNTISTPSWFTFRKLVKPSNFDYPSKLQTPIKFGVDKYVTNRIFFRKYLPQLLSFSNLYLSLSSFICLSYFKHDFLTLCPVSVLLLATSLSFFIAYQMFLTSPIRKHLYSHIPENSFGLFN